VPPPFAADTNVYVRAANEPAFRSRFEAFVQREGPLVVSGVVIAEVLIGVPDVRRHEAVVGALSAGTTPLAPEWDDWIGAAEAVSSLGGKAVTKTRSFWNDALLAAQCSRLRLTLVTSNLADFRRLARHLPLTVVAPFPP
jgi:predicted nucleic acid-binding protein